MNGTLPKPSVLGGAAIIGLGGSYLLSRIGLYGPPCPSRLLLHLPCPGCGLTRSWVALWHGDLLASFRYHPLGMALFLLCLLFLFAPLSYRSPRFRFGDPPFYAFLFRPGVLKGFSVLFFGIWLLRLGLTFSPSRFFLW
ncbi:MAG: DUF2752 domain-containing protein [Armatimonadetes bacterium]|nr:DUF2752 domain-containing protein [Armatimonadota bacterium]